MHCPACQRDTVAFLAVWRTGGLGRYACPACGTPLRLPVSVPLVAATSLQALLLVFGGFFLFGEAGAVAGFLLALAVDALIDRRCRVLVPAALDYRPPVPPELQILPFVLVAVVLLLQFFAWLGSWPALVRDRPLLGLVEMVLLLVLLGNGWRIRQWTARAHPPALPLATLAFTALALCVAGDLVNRNFGQHYFRHDAVIEHSYLVDSVLFFFPGYALLLYASWQATRARVPRWLQAPALVVGALAGVATFLDLAPAGMSLYATALTAAYTVLISLMVVAALWIAVAFGVAGVLVALGALLATVADALIGHFWLFGSGHYPGIAYLNFVVYFLSQALLQQLPVVVAARGQASAG